VITAEPHIFCHRRDDRDLKGGRESSVGLLRRIRRTHGRRKKKRKSAFDPIDHRCQKYEPGAGEGDKNVNGKNSFD